jgi:hypothetical protein
MKLPADRQLLCICRRIASVGLVLLFLLLFSVITFGWRGYILKYPDAMTGTVPLNFPVIAGGLTSSAGGMGTHELITWEEWERRQTQGTASVWVENGAGEGQQDRGEMRPLFYTYRMTELAPQRYMVHVIVTDRDDIEMGAQYRVEGNQITPLAFGMVTGGTMVVSLVVTVLLCWSLRAWLRWYTKHTDAEQEIRELLSQARLTLSLLVGYYLFLASRRASRLVWQRD